MKLTKTQIRELENSLYFFLKEKKLNLSLSGAGFCFYEVPVKEKCEDILDFEKNEEEENNKELIGYEINFNFHCEFYFLNKNLIVLKYKLDADDVNTTVFLKNYKDIINFLKNRIEYSDYFNKQQKIKENLYNKEINKKTIDN